MNCIDTSKLTASLDYHRANSHISIDDHVKSKMIDLGQEVTRRERIYLDKRYWILFRDVDLGRSSNVFVKELLNNLRERVKQGTSICPISESVFAELLKQEDLFTRKATARLIDELSGGVTLVPHPERVAQELCNYLYRTGGSQDLHQLDHLVWTKLSYVMGMVHPSKTPFSAEDELMLQKAFFDQMWDISLTEMIHIIDDAQPPEFDFDQLAEQLNIASRQHSNQIKSFRQAYLVEYRGALSVFMSTARKIIESIIERASNKQFEHPVSETESYEHELLEYFAKAVRKDEIALALPTLHLGALCHAAVRWDKKRNLTGNDLFDFHHAEAAVAYCNVFLTENPLKKLLEQNHLHIYRDFRCQIISSEKEALAWTTGGNS